MNINVCVRACVRVCVRKREGGWRDRRYLEEEEEESTLHEKGRREEIDVLMWMHEEERERLGDIPEIHLSFSSLCYRF